MNVAALQDDLPFVLRGKFFKDVVVDKKTGKATAKCVKCEELGKTKIINGNIRPTSNFSSHLKVSHSNTTN
jgi:hypothetical protein